MAHDNKDIEYRYVNVSAGAEEGIIEGYAVVFDVPSSPLLGFTEYIRKGSIDQALIDSCDIFMLKNHNPEHILARSNHGVGTLKVTVDEKGVFFRFAVNMNTELGRETYENVRLGNLTSCSFGYTISKNDKGAVKYYRDEQGNLCRDVLKIAEVFDLSIVPVPAFDQTTVHTRSEVEDFIAKEQMEEQETEQTQDEQQQPVEQQQEPEQQSEERAEPQVEEAQEQSQAEEQSEEQQEAEQQSEESVNQEETEEQSEAQQEPEPQQEENIRSINTTHTMSNFKFMSALRSLANGRPLDAQAAEVNRRGMEEASKAGINFTSQLVIPTEVRSVNVATEGADVVEVNIVDLLQPLREDTILAKAGARFYNGLVGDVQVPVMSKTNTYWSSETGATTATTATYTSVKLQPKRISTYIDVSKQFLLQDSIGCEQAIINDMAAALALKLEETVLGDGAGDTETPSGLFNTANLDSGDTVTNFKGLTDIEAAVADNCVKGEKVYLVSNKAASELRNMPKSAKTTQLVMEQNAIDGTKVLSTSLIANKKGIYGNFSDLCVGTWQSIGITVDPYSLATQGMVRIVVEGYVDAKLARKDGLKTFNI